MPAGRILGRVRRRGATMLPERERLGSIAERLLVGLMATGRVVSIVSALLARVLWFSRSLSAGWF